MPPTPSGPWRRHASGTGRRGLPLPAPASAPPARIVGRDGPLPLDEFRRTVEVNLIGSFNLLRLAAADMTNLDPLEDGERGLIVLTASVAAFEGQIGQAAYAASKGGIVGLTLPAARELARYGVRVVAIAPGIFATPMLAGLPQNVQDSLAASVPFPQRLGRPEEYAQTVLDLCRNVMINGSVIRLDGALADGAALEGDSLSAAVAQLVVDAPVARRASAATRYARRRGAGVDLGDIGRVAGEFDDQAVGRLRVDRLAIAVIGLAEFLAGRVEPRLQRVVGRIVDLQRDMVVAADLGRHLRLRLLVHLRVGELEEGEGAAVGQAEKGVAEFDLLAEIALCDFSHQVATSGMPSRSSRKRRLAS